MLTEMPAASPAIKPRRSLVRRVLRWIIGTGLIVLLVLAGAAWWLWSHRVELINHQIAVFGTMRAQIDNVELTSEGASLQGFELRDLKTNDLLLRLPEVAVKNSPRELLNHHVTLATVNDAEIAISEPFLEQILEQKESGADSGSITLPGGWKIDRVELRNAKLRYTERDGTREEIIANFHANDVSTDSDGSLNVGEQEITITAGGVALGDHAPVKVEDLRAKGRVHQGIIDLDELTIAKPVIALTPEFLDFLTPDSSSATKPNDEIKKPSVQRRAAKSFIHGLHIARVKCDNIELSATGFTPGNVAGIELPELKARVSYETSDLEWSEGEPVSPGTQWLRIEHLEIRPPQGAGSITCRSMNLTVQPPKDGRWTVGEFLLREPEIVWTPELRKLLLPPESEGGPPSSEKIPGQDARATQPWSLLLQSADVRDARVSFADVKLIPFELRGTLTLSVRDLLIDDKGAHSAEAQSLELKDVALGLPAKKAFFEMERGDFAVKPDAWNESKAVEKLVLSKPVVRMREGNTPWFSGSKPGSAAVPHGEVAASAPKSVVRDQAPDVPIWQQIHFGKLAITEGLLDFAEEQNGHDMEAGAKLNVTTDDAKPGLHRVRFDDFELRLPGLTLFPFPVARVSFVECSALLPDVWTQHRVESLHMGGANIEASSALMKFFETPPAPDALKPVTNPKLEIRNPKLNPEWTVGDLNIADSQVTLDKLVPGMDSVTFEVSLDIKDVPLSPEGLAADVASQRVELSRLKIPSPYGGQPVALLDTVFISFSPAGLIKKQIDKVEIVSPTLFLGQPLFWYVDYYRKYAEQNAHGIESKMASSDRFIALEAAVAAVANEPKTSEAGWSVHTLQVHSGKLVVAPKGRPLAGFRTPFPFSFTSEVTRGTLEADFEITSDDYEFADIKLKFEGLTGKVQFNLPMKGKDNNVTETFRVKRIRWKELHIEDAFLTVTYDAAGIYGKFGGNAYEGYVNGEFNIYLDDVYNWDGWIGGKAVQTREITQKFLPGTFFMEGKVAAHIIALGDGKQVYEADGKFDTQTPGKFSIEALNDLIKKLPESLSGLQQQFAQIGLEAMRDFAYDRVNGQFRTYGREGRGTLKFTGPKGSRNFEINAYDHRWKTDPPPDKTTPTTQVVAP